MSRIQELREVKRHVSNFAGMQEIRGDGWPRCRIRSRCNGLCGVTVMFPSHSVIGYYSELKVGWWLVRPPRCQAQLMLVWAQGPAWHGQQYYPKVQGGRKDVGR